MCVCGQRDRQPRGYCDMALRCLQQGDKGWEFGGKTQQQDGNVLCAIAPFAGGTHGAPQPQDVPVLRDALSLWHTLGEPRNLCETRWEGQAEPGQRSGSQAMFTKNCSPDSRMPGSTPEEEMDTGVQGTGASGQSQQD